ncbi:unnamed protein product [Soboliphyme baturini]|uniref:EF-hand domain-containing protein n=1 Tax=Soboliphyme baturini TaxID=241478 RepID=A0A183I8Z3_9BILA|nr:unnamed protein product [Soboliphyme baturini]
MSKDLQLRINLLKCLNSVFLLPNLKNVLTSGGSTVIPLNTPEVLELQNVLKQCSKDPLMMKQKENQRRMHMLMKAVLDGKSVPLEDLLFVFNLFAKDLTVNLKNVQQLVSLMTNRGIFHVDEMWKIVRNLNALKRQLLDVPTIAHVIGQDLVLRYDGRIMSKQAVMNEMSDLDIISRKTLLRMDNPKPTKKLPVVDYTTAKMAVEMCKFLCTVQNALNVNDQLAVVVVRDVEKVFLRPEIMAAVLLGRRAPLSALAENDAKELRLNLQRLLTNRQRKEALSLVSLMNLFNEICSTITVPAQLFLRAFAGLKVLGVLHDDDIKEIRNRLSRMKPPLTLGMFLQAVGNKLFVKEDGRVVTKRRMVLDMMGDGVAVKKVNPFEINCN